MDDVAKPAFRPKCPNCKSPTEPGNPFCTQCGLDLLYKPNSRGRGRCVYCPNVAPLTEEHVYGKWIAKAFGRRFPSTVRTLTRPNRIDLSPNAIMHRNVLERRGDPADRTVYNVCKTCNNGWMSRLHIEAKPLVMALANGDWPEFSDAQCKSLARWVTMISINIECLYGMLFTPREQRLTLMNGEMPETWQISIARTMDIRCFGSHWNCPLRLKIDPTEEHEEARIVRCGSCYFCVEQAVFYAVRSDTASELLEFFSRGDLPAIPETTRPVWPDNEHPDLRPNLFLVQQDLYNFHERLGTTAKS